MVPEFLTSKLQQIFKLVKQALKGEPMDYTQGSISKAVFLLAIPMILELSLESVFAVVDIFFVGKLGSSSIATVGLTESVLTIIYSIAIGLSTAATAIVSRRIGEGDPAMAAKTGAQALLIGLVIGMVLCALGGIYAAPILRWMGASLEVIEQGSSFTQIMLGSSVVIMLLFLINGIFRGAGDAAMAMRSLWIASLLNILLCPLFIHFWGLRGAALATVVGRSSGVLYQCYHLFKAYGVLRFNTSLFYPDGRIIRNIVRISWPATLQFIIASGSWILLARLVAETGGTEASAGYQIALRNIVFFILPAWGLSNAAATLVGQNLGAGQPARAEESVYLVSKYNAIFMAFVSILFVLFPKPIISFFSQDPAIVVHGVEALRIIGSAFVFYGVGMVMVQALNGAGDTRTPTWINVICFWLFQIPLAYFLAKGMDWNATGSYVAIPLAETMIAVLAWYYFRKGNWKQVRV